jgi:pSer/pThr/pTyr-binding forkhead associated (FHA) protein
MQLLIEDDEGKRSVVPGVPEEVTIGRKEGNAVRLPQRNVSRRHARLVRQNGRIYVEDVDARYGIKRNGQPIDDRDVFGEGDVVMIGDYRLTLRAEHAVDADPDQNDAEVEITDDLRSRIESYEPEETTAPDSSSTSQADSSAERSSTEVIQLDPAELVVVSSNFAGQTFPLDQEEMVVGRGEDGDIIIDHRSVSTTHAKIVRQADDDYKIVDLNSRNGVKVSGEEYKSTHLERGDIIQLGHVKFRFVEPGENYTFTPQDERPGKPDVGAEPTTADESSDDNTLLIVGGAVTAGLLALGIVAVLVMGGGGTEGSQSASANAPDKGTANAEGGAAAGGGEEDSETNDKVDKQIETAEQQIEKGKLDQAIGSLESIQNLLEPTADQEQRISKLLSRARSEQPYRRAFSEAKGALDNGKYVRALEKVESIPNHSVFYEIVREREVRKRALDKVFEKASGAFDKGEYERATALMEKALEYGARKEKAEELMAKIDEARQQAEDEKRARERAAARARERRERESGSSGGGEPSNTGSAEEQGGGGSGAQQGGSGGGKPAPENPGRLKQEAMKKILKGQFNAAIEDCQRALRAGHSDCYRVLGLAYNKLNNNAQACRNFEAYLKTNPRDAGRIRSKMSSIGCK